MLVWMLLQISTTSAAEFNPDRPGFADSTGAVPKGSLLTEIGATMNATGEGSSVAAPGLLIRGGLGAGVELRVAAPDLGFSLNGGDASVGGPAFGLKATASAGDIGFSVVGMAPVVPAATLADGFGFPLIGLNAAGPINDVYGWGLNTVATFGEDPTISWAGSAALGRTVGSRAGCYVQVAADTASSPLVGAGGTFTPLGALQLDLFVDYFPFDNAANIGIGIAKQW
ncbi:MAG: hypothetical protein AAFV53_16910 [Myxococcota bacterium]